MISIVSFQSLFNFMNNLIPLLIWFFHSMNFSNWSFESTKMMNYVHQSHASIHSTFSLFFFFSMVGNSVWGMLHPIWWHEANWPQVPSVFSAFAGQLAILFLLAYADCWSVIESNWQLALCLILHRFNVMLDRFDAFLRFTNSSFWFVVVPLFSFFFSSRTSQFSVGYYENFHI